VDKLKHWKDLTQNNDSFSEQFMIHSIFFVFVLLFREDLANESRSYTSPNERQSIQAHRCAAFSFG